ncbi:MAG: hypothetical protein KAX78_08355 [Phycisphaerae bacterium]|nr:hypothetical protein [Phycisphaerae bacterium]
MSNPLDLIFGRLGAPLGGGEGGQEQQGHPAHYGICRLGLVPEGSDPAEPSGTDKPTAARDDPYKRGTYKLPKELIRWLKAYALTTHQYQYSVVTEAIKRYLDEVTEGLAVSEKPNLADLGNRYDQQGSALPQPTAPSAHRIGFDPVPRCSSDPPDYDRTDLPDPYAADACSDLCCIPDVPME